MKIHGQVLDLAGIATKSKKKAKETAGSLTSKKMEEELEKIVLKSCYAMRRTKSFSELFANIKDSRSTVSD